MATLYANELRKRGISHVHELRMRDSLDAAPRYRLIFTTRSAHGSFLMSDIAAKHEADLFAARWEGTFEIDWQHQRRADSKDLLRSEIHRWGLEQGAVTTEQIILHFAPQKFGEWRTSDYSACIRELIQLGGIDRPRGTAGIANKERLHFLSTLQESLFAPNAG